MKDVTHIDQFGRYHRLDGPAIERNNVSEWWQFGKLHRTNGPAIVRSDGTKYWYQNGQLHRLDGPAVVSPMFGFREWRIDGKLHREDGPAIETIKRNLASIDRYYLNNKLITDINSNEEFLDYIRLWKIQQVLES